MVQLRQHSITLLLAIIYFIVAGFLVWNRQEYLILFPVGLIAIYAAVFYTDYTFLSLAFLTPLSVNIEEYTDSFGLFIPTEPLLFGLMILLFLFHLKKQVVLREVWKHPIIWAAGFYLFWILVTSITSTHVVASFKFLLARMWFFIPLLLLGPLVFQKEQNVKRFLWLFVIGMVVAISYTLVVHAQYSFGEDEGHWVMWPFFKDHTVYGASVALVTPIVFGIYWSKKHTALTQAILIAFIGIILLGLYFSYTRAAWLSVVAAVGVLGLIKFKVPFKFLAILGAVLGLVVFSYWDQIQMELERNKYEHTTEEFGERLQSATNVTTDASNLERLNRWSCAIDMFNEKPVFGFGPGTYAFEYARFQRPENLTIISTNFGDMGNAHSEYLGALAEMGFIGMVSVLVLVVSIFYTTIRLYYKWPEVDTEMRTLILAMILSLVTYFVHAFLNNYLDTDKAAVPIWGMCAAMIALDIKIRKKEVESV